MQQIALQILAIFGMIGLGFFIERRQWFPPSFSAHLSKLIISIFYPCLLFAAILQKYTLAKLAADWVMPLGAAGIILVGWSVGWCAKRWVMGRMRAPTRRAFHFTCTMNNYSFLPIMIVAGTTLGTSGVALVALTTIASDTLMWTLGFSTLTGQRMHWRELPKMCLRPPVMALLLAMGCLVVCAVVNAFTSLNITNETLLANPYSALVLNTLYTAIGGATIPMSAMVCGMCLGRIPLSGMLSRLQLKTVLFRMVLIPAITVSLIAWIPGLTDAQRFIFALIALMPGAMGGVSIAEVYGGDTPFVSAMILNTHVLCIVTIPLGLYLLSLVSQLPAL